MALKNDFEILKFFFSNSAKFCAYKIRKYRNGVKLEGIVSTKYAELSEDKKSIKLYSFLGKKLMANITPKDNMLLTAG